MTYFKSLFPHLPITFPTSPQHSPPAPSTLPLHLLTHTLTHRQPPLMVVAGHHRHHRPLYRPHLTTFSLFPCFPPAYPQPSHSQTFTNFFEFFVLNNCNLLGQIVVVLYFCFVGGWKNFRVVFHHLG
jgi:hypothetical protein